MKRRNFTKNKKKNKNKKYFDTDLQILRKNLTNYGKCFSKYSCDPRIRGHYYKLLREYNKVRKSKYRLYKKSLLHQIEMLHDKDPKQYWKLIEELKDTEKIDTTSSISTSTWQSHFQNLNNPKDIYKNRIKWLEDKLSQLEKIKCFTDIDGKITEAEINSAIKEMKSNKSTGLDNISNEMLKSGQSFLIPCFHKLFNNCFTMGYYPENWTHGYITPIHKGNDPSDPNNYRGITITNSLGKLFNRILDNRLTKFLDKHHVINDSQMGFTKKARTSDHMFILKTIIDKYCNNKGGRVFAYFVDFQKSL